MAFVEGNVNMTHWRLETCLLDREGRDVMRHKMGVNLLL
jgi:hypothetical protein